MLCAVCLSMFQNPTPCGPHHRDVQAVKTAAKYGCRICITLFQSKGLHVSFPLGYRFKWNMGWSRHWDIFFYRSADARKLRDLSVDEYDKVKTQVVYVQVAAGEAHEGYADFLKTVRDDLRTDPAAVRRDFPPTRYIASNTGHQDVLRLARQWLDKCKGGHKCEQPSLLRESSYYPSRLIKVGRNDQDPQLVLRENNNNLHGPYAALSHCWGGVIDFLMLNADLVDKFRQSIPFESLPASFQDAIVACRHLGIQYIWIDSLCILQRGRGAREDWLAHANEMHRIYANCELNLAIDAASNPHGGAFRSRDTQHLQDCVAWTPYHSPKAPKLWNPDEVSDDSSDDELAPAEQQPATAQMNRCTIFNKDDFSFSRASLPLNKRAWVLQEKLMSPRTLHFQADRIFWECDEKTTLSEYMPDGMAGEKQGFDCMHQSAYSIKEPGRQEQRFGFFDYVSQFAERQLSHADQDKLVAFSAIARTCATWAGAPYCAGIFRQAMPWGLVWRASPQAPSKRPAYRAPSWSWASVDARVYFDTQPYATMTDMTVVNDISVDLVDPANEFGQVRSAWIQVTGPLLSSRALRNEHGVDGEFPGYGRIQFFVEHNFRADWDEIAEDSARGQEVRWAQARLSSRDDVYLLAIGEQEYPEKMADDSATQGLILEKVEGDTYQRAGIWEAEIGFLKHYMSEQGFQPRTIRIV